jgi:hypothetical protein
MPVYTPSAVINVRDLAPTVQGGTTVTGTSAGTVLATLVLPNTAALYEVTVYGFVSGTVTATEANNIIVKQGATTLSTVPVVQSATVGAVPFVLVVNSANGTTITVNVGAATPGGSAGYNVSAVARQISA